MLFRAHRTRGILTLLCATIIAPLGLTSCGGAAPASPDSVVARVNGNSITAARLEHWTKIEAVLAYQSNPTVRVPRGVVPDPPTYRNCIAYLQGLAKPPKGQRAPTPGQLKAQCAATHSRLQRHILDILLIYYWLKGEAAERGVRLANAEITAIVDRVAPNAAALRKYLSITGERLTDLRLIAEKDLFDSKLLELKEHEFAKAGQTSPHQHEHALIAAATEFTNKWASRTSCLRGYVISDCKQYRGTRSLVAP